MFDIQRYNNKNKLEWDSFVPGKNNGTLFHLRSFLNYHPVTRFKDHSLLFYKKNKLFSVFPAAEKVVKSDHYRPQSRKYTAEARARCLLSGVSEDL